MHLIRRILSGYPHYWNSTGWTRYRRNARRFSAADAERVFQQMSDDGLLRIAIGPAK